MESSAIRELPRASDRSESVGLDWLNRHLDRRLPPFNHDAKAGVRPSWQIKHVLYGAHRIGPQRLSSGAGHRNLQAAIDIVETGYKLDFVVGCEGHSHGGATTLAVCNAYLWRCQ